MSEMDWPNSISHWLLYILGAWKLGQLISSGADRFAEWVIKRIERPSAERARGEK